MGHINKLCIIYEDIQPKYVKHFINSFSGELTLVTSSKFKEKLEGELSGLHCQLNWYDLNAALFVGTYKYSELVAMAAGTANWHFDVLKKATTSQLVGDLFDSYRDPLVYSIQEILFVLMKEINNCIYYIDAIDNSEIYVFSRKKKAEDLRFTCFKEFIAAKFERKNIQWIVVGEYDFGVKVNHGGSVKFLFRRITFVQKKLKRFALYFLKSALMKLGPRQSDVYEKLSVIIRKTKKVILNKWQADSWVVCTNYDPRDFRVNTVARRLLKGLVSDSDCLAVDRGSGNSTSFESFRFEITNPFMIPKVYNIKFGGDRSCFTDVIEDGFLSNSFLKNFSTHWISLCDDTKDDHYLSSPHMIALSRFTTSTRSVKRFTNVIAMVSMFEQYFLKHPLKGLLFVGGDHDVFSRTLVLAARTQKIPTYSYNFLINSGNPLSRKPLCENVFVSDSTMAEAYVAQYPDLKNKLILSGSHVIDARRLEYRNAKKTRSGKYADKFLLLYVTQPIGKPSIQCLDYLIAALNEVDCRLIVRPHPSEVKAGTVQVYHDTIALNQAHDWIEVDHESDIIESLAAADVVFTVFSNVGIEAAVLGKLVGALQLPGIPVPFDLSRFGIAAKLDSEKLIRDFVLDAMIGGSLAKSCREKQNQFLQKNPQLLHGMMEERVLAILLQAR